MELELAFYICHITRSLSSGIMYFLVILSPFPTSPPKLLFVSWVWKLISVLIKASPLVCTGLMWLTALSPYSSLVLVSSTCTIHRTDCTWTWLSVGDTDEAVTLGCLCPWLSLTCRLMQNFITSLQNKSRCKTTGKLVGSTASLGDRVKRKSTLFHIKIPIRQHPTAKAFLFQRPAPSSFL